MEHVALERVFPLRNIDFRFVYSLNSFLAADDTNSAKPVYVTKQDGRPIDTKSEIEGMFSTITYGKVCYYIKFPTSARNVAFLSQGGSLLRMIDRAIFYEHPVAFRDALRDHVRRHVHAFATTRDLLAPFDRVCTGRLQTRL